MKPAKEAINTALLLGAWLLPEAPYVTFAVTERKSLSFYGAFTPVLAKHTKHLSLVDIPLGRRGQHATELRADEEVSRKAGHKPAL